MTGDRGAGPSLSARFAGASDLPAFRTGGLLVGPTLRSLELERLSGG
jgi:hypothetical protein